MTLRNIRQEVPIKEFVMEFESKEHASEVLNGRIGDLLKELADLCGQEGLNSLFIVEGKIKSDEDSDSNEYAGCTSGSICSEPSNCFGETMAFLYQRHPDVVSSDDPTLRDKILEDYPVYVYVDSVDVEDEDDDDDEPDWFGNTDAWKGGDDEA